MKCPVYFEKIKISAKILSLTGAGKILPARKPHPHPHRETAPAQMSPHKFSPQTHTWEFFFFYWTKLGTVFIHMMKIHLPNMYMIFECHTVENKYVALFYNTPKLSTFRIISDSLKLFAPNSLGPFQLLHFLLFF